MKSKQFRAGAGRCTGWLAGCFWKKECVVRGQRAVLLSARLLNPAGSQRLGNMSAAQMVEQDWSGQGPS